MSSTIPALPVHTAPPAPAPTKAAAKPPAAAPPTKASEAKVPEKAADTPLRPAGHRAASALSPADVGYVDSLLGVAPAQIMEYILLKTGIPQPAHLGQDLDTSA